LVILCDFADRPKAKRAEKNIVGERKLDLTKVKIAFQLPSGRQKLMVREIIRKGRVEGTTLQSGPTLGPQTSLVSPLPPYAIFVGKYSSTRKQKSH
jgi:hypothetical protein